MTIVGSQIEGGTAAVWLLTNDEPPFEDYEVHCVRRHGRWHADAGYPFSGDTPDEIVEQARRMG